MLHAQFQPEASSSSARKSKPILNTAGRLILKEFYEKVSHKPTREQKLELLRNVILAGNSHYDEMRLNAWFANHRKQTRKTESFSARPTFTPQAEAELAICFNETPHPSDELVAIWARGFHVTPDFVHEWIARRRERNSQTGAGRLPTPDTTSPEPEYGRAQTKRRQTSLSPIDTAKTQVPTPTTTPIVSPRSLPSPWHSPRGKIMQPLDVGKVDKKPTHSERLLRAIGEDMERAELAPLSWRSPADAAPSSPVAVAHCALSTDTSALSPTESSSFVAQHQGPRFMSADDFLASFAPYEVKMKGFLGKVGRGELEEKGWRSTMVPHYMRS